MRTYFTPLSPFWSEQNDESISRCDAVLLFQKYLHGTMWEHRFWFSNVCIFSKSITKSKAQHLTKYKIYCWKLHFSHEKFRVFRFCYLPIHWLLILLNVYNICLCQVVDCRKHFEMASFRYSHPNSRVQLIFQQAIVLCVIRIGRIKYGWINFENLSISKIKCTQTELFEISDQLTLEQHLKHRIE